jgi:hypothetical protein
MGSAAVTAITRFGDIFEATALGAWRNVDLAPRFLL